MTIAPEDVNPHIQRDIPFELYVRGLFLIQQDQLTLWAIQDKSRRRNLRHVLGPIEDVLDNRGAQVNYNKKSKSFDFLQYTMKGRAKRFTI